MNMKKALATIAALVYAGAIIAGGVHSTRIWYRDLSLGEYVAMPNPSGVATNGGTLTTGPGRTYTW